MNSSLAYRACESKVGALLEYICSQIPHIHLRKLLKLVYMMDEQSVCMRSIPLTWLDYYAWKKGPVAPDVYAVKEGKLDKYVTCTKESDGRYYVSAKKSNPYAIDRDMEVFSEYEMGIINDVIAVCKDKSADELTDETHREDSLWSQVVTQNHITFADSDCSEYLVDLNDLNDQEGKEIYAEALDCVMMQASLNPELHV